MSTERTQQLPEYENSGGIETDLTLGLPGDLQVQKSGVKRGFSEVVDLKMANNSKAESQPPSKTQVVGWPPVRSYRKNLMKNCKYVKVAADGAPYLRKIDLEIYSSYEDLLSAMGDMFTCLTIRKHIKKTYLIDSNGEEYVPTYEDKDGDWMLVGDVPWKMFVESCKRVRLMRSSEATGLGAEGPDTPSKGSSTSC